MRRLVGLLPCLLAVIAVLLLPGLAMAHDETTGGPHADHVDTPQELSDVDLAQEVDRARLQNPSLAPLQAGSPLPTTWCGNERTSDDTTDAAAPASAPQFKVLYLHPSDRPDRFAQWKDLIQADASLIGQFVSGQSGSSRAPRFDLGTSCGAGYVDIQTVHLPSTRATYVDNFSAIKAAVHAAVGTPAGPRNYIVLADTLNGGSGGSYGLGDYYAGSASAERPDAANPHNGGDLFAVLFYRDVIPPTASANGWWPTGMLHEMTHTMGAVQWSAPHTTQPAGGTSGTYGHCWDGLDIMCYADGPAMSHPYVTSACSALPGAMDQTYDCNQDDYFNPNPTPGSYLATHWDVYNNVFLADCSTLPAGTCVSSVAPVGPPVNSVLPTITGTARRGQSLAVNAGTWNPAGTTYAFQWQRDSGSGFVDISGATGTSYTLVGADVTTTLRARVTATNASGSATAATAATATVVADPPVNSAVPVIGGTTRRTYTLTASAGSWTPSSGLTYTYQWQRDSGSGFADISGATAGSYLLVTADVTARVRVKVTATNADAAVSALSAPTAVIGAAVPGLVTSPVVSGATKSGEVVTASTGAWSPAAASYTYQWQRRASSTWADISGATATSYTLGSADVGATIRVTVTATNADGSTAATSAATAIVTAPPVLSGTIPAPTGTLTDTGQLTAAPGTWTPTGTYTYQWMRCPAGATSAATGCLALALGPVYTLTGADVGHTMAVRVTAAVDGAAASAVSLPTADITGRALTNVRAPSILGGATVAESVRVVPGLWSVNLLTSRDVWQRCDVDGTNCVDIPGASGMVYAVTPDDADHALVVREAVTSPGRSATLSSAPVVVADQPLPAAAILPTISGALTRTSNLQLRPGTWANTTRLTYAWQRCASDGTGCVAIPRATNANYVLAAVDVGHTIVVAVTGTNSSGTTTASSAATAVVGPMLPELRSGPVITGTLQVPNPLQAARMMWKSTPDTRYRLQWQRCNGAGVACADIAGATTPLYKLKAADARSTLKVLQTATNPDGAVTATSATTVAVKPALPGIGTYPRISVVGRPDVGKTATITPGVWSSATEIDTKDIAFWRCSPRCATIPSGGARTYVIDPLDAGAMLRGSETATGPGGTVTAWSPTWIGPVRSTSAGFRTLAAGGEATLRTSAGVALARVAVGEVQAVASRVAQAQARAKGTGRAGTVKVSVRRSASAASRRLRAWACVTPPKVTDRQPCTKAVALRGRRVTLRLTVAKGQRVLVVVARRR